MEMVKTLKAAGSDFHATTADGYNAMDLAVLSGKWPVAVLLLSWGVFGRKVRDPRAVWD